MYGIWSERPIPSEFAALIEGRGFVAGSGRFSSDAFWAAADQVNAIFAGAGFHFDADFMQKVPNLKVIARSGIGVDNIDLAAATEHGVAVCNAPDVPTQATAEHAITLIFAATKHLRSVTRLLEQGERRDIFTGHRAVEIEGLSLGLVGFGRIGRRVARIGRGMGMYVTGYDPFLPAEAFEELGVRYAPTLEALLTAADVVSLHLPSTPETHHLMNAERFSQMKHGSYLINTARGTLVDEAALLDALESGHLSGAGLDVFDPEPPSPDNPLLHRDDVIATPHVGGISATSRRRFWEAVITQSLQVLDGERPANLVNPEVWPRLRGG